jgi:hypothetical protein
MNDAANIQSSSVCSYGAYSKFSYLRAFQHARIETHRTAHQPISLVQGIVVTRRPGLSTRLDTSGQDAADERFRRVPAAIFWPSSGRTRSANQTDVRRQTEFEKQVLPLAISMR